LVRHAGIHPEGFLVFRHDDGHTVVDRIASEKTSF
jgi:hypothetical protein